MVCLDFPAQDSLEFLRPSYPERPGNRHIPWRVPGIVRSRWSLASFCKSCCKLPSVLPFNVTSTWTICRNSTVSLIRDFQFHIQSNVKIVSSGHSAEPGSSQPLRAVVPNLGSSFRRSTVTCAVRMTSSNDLSSYLSSFGKKVIG